MFLHDYWTRSDSGQDVDQVVTWASVAISEAKRIIERHEPGNGESDSDPAATKALIWLNALLFQTLLSQSLDHSQLPEPYNSGFRIPAPRTDLGVEALLEQWNLILKVNWWPIFFVACETLSSTSPRAAKLALDRLGSAARSIASSGAIRRHDVAGRIFHRLLDTRKFLATNYTTIPAAMILAALAFDRKHFTWRNSNFADESNLTNLAVVDPACGSGTLLMAAFQELTRHIQREGSPSKQLTKCILENSLYGFDVVPAAIHLAASTLSMAQTSQLISKMQLWRLQHGILNEQPRLGSLDLLSTSPTRGNAQRLELLGEGTLVDATRVTGTGEALETNVRFPPDCDVVIANPPYTRAGGPGDGVSTGWNPIFGSLMNDGEQTRMNDALNQTLLRTPASVYAGLGSAFVQLADENVRQGGRLAFVLPSTVITGSSWSRIRRLLRTKYRIDWVIASHDPRSRPQREDFPGRLFVSFSESTKMAEVLIVATRVNPSHKHKVRFVNLRHNPVSPIDANSVSRALMEMPNNSINLNTTVTASWGQVHHAKQSLLDDNPWIYTAFVQSHLYDAIRTLISNEEIPLCTMGKNWTLGPYEMNVKHANQGLFSIDDNPDPMRHGYRALWHHSSNQITSLRIEPNAHLTPRSDRDPVLQKNMLHQSSRLHMARSLRTNTQRLSTVLTDTPILGVSSWITLIPNAGLPGEVELMCLWHNSTPGLLLRLIHSNRPYLGRHGITHSTIPTLLSLDTQSLPLATLDCAQSTMSDICNCELLPIHQMDEDPVRQRIDESLFGLLGMDPSRWAKIRRMMAREPQIHGGKRAKD